MSEPYVIWIEMGHDASMGKVVRWDLMVGRKGRRRSAATVWDNGTWHTWDKDGVGGENDVEKTVALAKIEAAASAIAQGFI